STLHTGDAPSAVTRLHEMGVERYVVGAGLAAVLGQRLVRRLCLYCRERYEPAADVLEHAGSTSSDAAFFPAVGCPYCYRRYFGRIGVFELLVLHDARPSAGLWSDALAKAEAGMTSLDELYRVVRRCRGTTTVPIAGEERTVAFAYGRDPHDARCFVHATCAVALICERRRPSPRAASA